MSLPPLPHAETAKITALIDKRIADARAALERHPTAEADSQFLRGQIHALRELHAWANPPLPPQPEPEHRRLSEPPTY